MEPAIGSELGEQRLEVAEGLVGSCQADLQVGGLHGELDLAEGVGGLLGEGLEAGESECGLVFFGECRGDLLPDALVVGKECLEAVPDLEGLVVFLGALVDATQGLEDFEEVVAGGFAGEGAFERGGGQVGLTDQDEGLAEIVGGQGVVGPSGLGLPEGLDGGGVLAALRFEEADHEPAGAVVGSFGEAVVVTLDEGSRASRVRRGSRRRGRAGCRGAEFFSRRERKRSMARCSRASSAATGSAGAAWFS